MFSTKILPQVCPVDLTRSITSSTSDTSSDKATCRKLAFSVENILDPTKFCSKKEKYNNNGRHWPNEYDRNDVDRLDDEQSESQSGKLAIYVKVKYINITITRPGYISCHSIYMDYL